VSNVCKPNAIYIPKNANKHFGSVGDKVTVKAFVLNQDHYENDFGYNNYSVKIKYITENGERLVTNGGDTLSLIKLCLMQLTLGLSLKLLSKNTMSLLQRTATKLGTLLH
jgi:hypothetical protein